MPCLRAEDEVGHLQAAEYSGRQNPARTPDEKLTRREISDNMPARLFFCKCSINLNLGVMPTLRGHVRRKLR